MQITMEGIVQISTRYQVWSDGSGHHVFDTKLRRDVIGPFALRSKAQEAADKRNRLDARK